MRTTGLRGWATPVFCERWLGGLRCTAAAAAAATGERLPVLLEQLSTSCYAASVVQAVVAGFVSRLILCSELLHS